MLCPYRVLTKQRSYDNGNDAYFEELHERFSNGELLDSDSITVNDSLKFYTPKGKVVYGGGGIMPDVFVPYDTSGMTAYLSKVSNKGLIYRFGFNYADTHRDKLSSLNNAAAIESYLQRQNLLPDFVAFAEERGVPRKPADIQKSKKELETRLMASVARNILDNDGYYPIMAKIDNTLDKAVEILSNQLGTMPVEIPYFLFKITKAAITPGTHPARVSKNTINTLPHPLSITANGGKNMANITRSNDIC